MCIRDRVKDTNDTTGVTTDWQDSADYDIGDDVPFQLTATLADVYKSQVFAQLSKTYNCEYDDRGTIDDIKDFMFVVTDDKDTPYSFNFDEKPDGLEGLSLIHIYRWIYSGQL